MGFSLLLCVGYLSVQELFHCVPDTSSAQALSDFSVKRCTDRACVSGRTKLETPNFSVCTLLCDLLLKGIEFSILVLSFRDYRLFKIFILVRFCPWSAVLGGSPIFMVFGATIFGENNDEEMVVRLSISALLKVTVFFCKRSLWLRDIVMCANGDTISARGS